MPFPINNFFALLLVMVFSCLFAVVEAIAGIIGVYEHKKTKLNLFFIFYCSFICIFNGDSNYSIECKLGDK